MIITSWFRMRPVWPLLAAFLFNLNRPVTVWSAACGTGEEAYSVAMLLEAHSIPGRVIATDTNPALVAHARRARYSDRSVVNTEVPSLSQWLTSHGEQPRRHWRPLPSIRSRVSFAVATLGVDPPPKNCDVVLARNVWRHMTPPMQRVAAHQIAETLTPGGWLLLGGAELNGFLPPTLHAMLAIRSVFEVSPIHECINTVR